MDILMVAGKTPDNTPETAGSLRPSFLPEMQLHCPTTLGDVFVHMANGARLLSGGTDILLQAGQNGTPDRLVWTGGIEALKEFSTEGDELIVGAAVPFSRMIRSQSFRDGTPAVIDGAKVVGSTQLRFQATMAGNVCTASPSADTVPGLLVHNCRVEITNNHNEHRKVDLKDFIVGPGKTTLAEDELVMGLTLVPLKKNETSAYQRFTQRNALDLAFACVAAKLEYEEDNRTLKAVKLVLGAVGPTVIDASEAVQSLIGHPLDDERLAACSEAASQLSKPISDHRASADYRRQLISVLVMDVITQAANRYGNKS